MRCGSAVSEGELLPPTDTAVLGEARVHLLKDKAYLSRKPVVRYGALFPLSIDAGDGHV